MEASKFQSRLNFHYGLLDDKTVWINPPSHRLFRVDQRTLQVILDLNKGTAVEEVCRIHDVDMEEIQRLISKLSRERAIEDPRWARVTFESGEKDIPLSGFIWQFIALAAVQFAYFRFFAHTYLMKHIWEGIAVAAVAVAVVFFHEMGHYFTTVKYLKTRPRVGFTFLFIFPAIYVDTQQAWVLPRNKRLVISGAGVFMDCVVNVFAILLVVLHHPLEYYVTPFLLTQYTRMVTIINPFFRTDGYWLLSDATRVINLSTVGKQDLRKLKFNLLSLYSALSMLLMAFSLLGLGWFIFTFIFQFIVKYIK
jgi:hypothetical protein